MELPAGKPIKEGMETQTVDFRKLFPALKEHKLTGYLALDIMASNGMEEGTLLFNQGEVIAVDYIYLAKEKIVNGQDALELVMNSCSGAGSFDVYEIESSEIIGVREKNREKVLKYKPTNEELMSLLPDTFDDRVLAEEQKRKIEAETIKSMGGVSKDDILKKYGISRPDEKMVDKLIDDLNKDAVV